MIKKGLPPFFLPSFTCSQPCWPFFYTNYTADEMDYLLTEALNASQDQNRDKAMAFSEKSV